MTTGDVITVARETIWVIAKTSLPILLISMIVGLVISLFQTLTSIQEQTLTFVPKLLAILLGLMVLGTWMLNEIVSYMQEKNIIPKWMKVKDIIEFYRDLLNRAKKMYKEGKGIPLRGRNPGVCHLPKQG